MKTATKSIGKTSLRLMREGLFKLEDLHFSGKLRGQTGSQLKFLQDLHNLKEKEPYYYHFILAEFKNLQSEMSEGKEPQ